MKKKSASKIGKMARRKGHQFERETAIALRSVYPEARRRLENHREDANGVDLMGTGPFRIQCKRGRSYAPITKIEEVEEDLVGESIPLLVTAGDNARTMAVMGFDDFLKLLRMIHKTNPHAIA